MPTCLGCPLQAGWNRLKCTSCGTNVLTDTTDTGGLGLSADQCYIPPGWGTEPCVTMLTACPAESVCATNQVRALPRRFGKQRDRHLVTNSAACAAMSLPQPHTM